VPSPIAKTHHPDRCAAGKIGGKRTWAINIDTVSMSGEVSSHEEKKLSEEKSIDYEVNWATVNFDLTQS